MPRAIVINPWVCDFKLYDEWMHPLGLYFLISLLKHNGWDVRYINCLGRDSSAKPKRFGTGEFAAVPIAKPPFYRAIPRIYKRYGVSPEAFDAALHACPSPDAVFVGSHMTYWIDGLAETVFTVRRAFPQTPIVIGGISAILMPEVLRPAFPGVLVYGSSLLPAFTSGDAPHASLPFGLTTAGWNPDFIAGFNSCAVLHHAPVLLSLGCPHNCSYCASRQLQPSVVFRPLDTVIGEIMHASEKFGVRDFAFYDDALLYNPSDRVMALLDEIARRGLSVRFHTPNGLHVRLLTAEVLSLMRKAGFETLRLGYESGLGRYDADTRSKAGYDALRRASGLIRNAGFTGRRTGVYIMAGLWGQREEEVIEEMTAVAALGLTVKPVFLSPAPGSELFGTYSKQFPELALDPHWHNDIFFITKLPGWDWAAAERVKAAARKLNASL